MASWDDDRSPEEVAALATAIAHPARVAMLRLLRQEPTQRVPGLRRALRPAWDLDTRGILHHLGIMARAGVVDVRSRPRSVRLLRNVRLQTHAASGNMVA